jgi:hypothetical protein
MAVANPITALSRPEGMFRRDFVKILPVLMAGAALASTAGADTDTPVKQAFLRWKDAYAAANLSQGPISDDDLEAMVQEVGALADDVARIAAQGPCDIIYKIVAATSYGDFTLSDGALGRAILTEASNWVEVAL